MSIIIPTFFYVWYKFRAMDLKIGVERNIHFGSQVFSTIGEVYLFDGSDPKAPWRLPRDLDLLVVRSNVRVDEDFLRPFTNLKAILSPTIGLDHIDSKALVTLQKRLSRRIPVINAPGSTASGVGDYVAGAVLYLLDEGIVPSECTVGIWGYGNCGKAAARRLQALGCRTRAFDPPLEDFTEGRWQSVDLSELLQSDIITLHVPLTFRNESPWPTYRMIDRRILEVLKGKVLINTSRGGVIDERELERSLLRRELVAVIDVYEHEPTPSRILVKEAFVATPHIAGSIRQGKLRAVQYVYEKACNLLGLQPIFNFRLASERLRSPYRIRSVPLTRAAKDVLRRAIDLPELSRHFRSNYLASEEPGITFQFLRLRGMRDEILWPWEE